MSDLISRKKAIEALDFEIVHMTVFSNDEKNGTNPLAQYNKGLEDGIKALEALPSAEPERKWIPVTERLPEDENEVIVTVCDKSGCTPDYYSAIGIYSTHLNRWIVDMISENVIAWMPLPEPWSGEK